MSRDLQTRKPTIVIRPDALAASTSAAQIIAETIQASAHPVLGLATGGTPIDTYRELVRMHQQDGLEFSHVTTFNLDEYIGLAPDHPQSYRHFMQQQLLDHVNVDRANTHVPDGLAADPQAHAAEYEGRIAAAGGIDLQMLGIGHNGHIAFNEPGAAIDCRTRVVELTEQTIEKNSRFFESIDDVPRTALTMGIGTILEAKQILMLATGRDKAKAVQQAIEGEPESGNPASFLQLHGNVTFVLDQQAASGLSS